MYKYTFYQVKIAFFLCLGITDVTLGIFPYVNIYCIKSLSKSEEYLEVLSLCLLRNLQTKYKPHSKTNEFSFWFCSISRMLEHIFRASSWSGHWTMFYLIHQDSRFWTEHCDRWCDAYLNKNIPSYISNYLKKKKKVILICVKEIVLLKFSILF